MSHNALKWVRSDIKEHKKEMKQAETLFLGLILIIHVI